VTYRQRRGSGWISEFIEFFGFIEFVGFIAFDWPATPSKVPMKCSKGAQVRYAPVKQKKGLTLPRRTSWAGLPFAWISPQYHLPELRGKLDKL